MNITFIIAEHKIVIYIASKNKMFYTTTEYNNNTNYYYKINTITTKIY